MSDPFVFLTRHYPPNPNINGESVCDLVEYLEQEHGIRSTVIFTDRSFAGGGRRREPAGRLVRMWTPYQGQNALLRFFTFFYDGLALALNARKYRHSWIVCTTSPPLLPFWAALFFKKRKWALWAFDLFPEGFSATGLIGANNPFYRFVKRLTYRGRPDLLITLGPRQAAHLCREYGRDIPTLLLPCGVFFHLEKSTEQPEWYDSDKTILGYCGNLGDPHNPDFVRAAIDHIDPAKQLLVLALYGNQAPAVKAYAAGKPGVVLVDSVPRNQLHFIQVHLVSLRRSWTHIAVPSKAVSAVSMGGALLFCGDRDSDNWHMFQSAGWFIDEQGDIAGQVAGFLQALTPEAVREKQAATPGLYRDLQAAVRESYLEISRLG